MDFPDLGFVADHAYWVTGIKTAADGLGTVDAVSGAFGKGDPAPVSASTGGGVLTGGSFPALPYESQSLHPGPETDQPKTDTLALDLENLKTLTVNMKQAKLTCDADVEITSDAPVKVKLAGCGRTVSGG